MLMLADGARACARKMPHGTRYHAAVDIAFDAAAAATAPFAHAVMLPLILIWRGLLLRLPQPLLCHLFSPFADAMPVTPRLFSFAERCCCCR